MANPAVITTDTKLYCAAEPKGRLFHAGEPWPGDAWTAKSGGKPLGEATNAAALKDLAEAISRIDQMERALASKDHDLAQLAGQRDDAISKVADLEQRAIGAEAGRTAAEQAAAGYMGERDRARADAKRFSDAVDGLRPEAEQVPGLRETIERLTGELNAANQALADANTAPKAKKAAKTDDAGAGAGG